MGMKPHILIEQSLLYNKICSLGVLKQRFHFFRGAFCITHICIIGSEWDHISELAISLILLVTVKSLNCFNLVCSGSPSSTS